MIVGIFLVALILAAIVLHFEFGELTVPLPIFVVKVLSLLGVFGTLSLAAFTLVTAQNAIFVLQAIKGFQGEGFTLDEAIVKMGPVRALPILAIMRAALFALPLPALGIGSRGQVQQSPAIAAIGGFSLSIFLLLPGLPMVHGLFKR